MLRYSHLWISAAACFDQRGHTTDRPINIQEILRLLGLLLFICYYSSLQRVVDGVVGAIHDDRLLLITRAFFGARFYPVEESVRVCDK